MVENNYTEQQLQLREQYSQDQFESLIDFFSCFDGQSEPFLIEQIRNFAEFLVYGEKYENQYFDKSIVEGKVLDHFVRFLSENNRDVNIQLIQTSAILVQNINDKQRLNLLFEQPFFNKLIEHDWEAVQDDDELVDYLINFMKTLTLKLDQDTLKYFYSSDTNSFSLLQQASQFFNHKDQLVRTSVRTITLTLLSIQDSYFQVMVASLPHCMAFIYQICFLKDIWIAIDKIIQSTGGSKVSDASKRAAVDQILSYTEDANDILEYIQDILLLQNERLNRMLTNALMSYAYLPIVVQSLVVMKKAPTISITTSLHILTRTFSIIKDQQFTSMLFACLFVEELPKDLIEILESIKCQSPRSYLTSFEWKHTDKFTHTQFVELYYDSHNQGKTFNKYLIEQSKTSLLLQIYKEQFEVEFKKSDDLPTPEENKEDEKQVENEENQETDQLFSEYIFKNISESDKEQIKQQHQIISKCLGVPVGLVQKQSSGSQEHNDQLRKSDFISLLEMIYAKDQDQQLSEKFDRFMNKSILLQFLNSKDDSLLLLLGGLIFTMIQNKKIDPRLLGKVPGFKRFLSSKECQKDQKEEVKIDTKLSDQDKKSLEQIVSIIFSMMTSDPPLRNFTIRVYTKILLQLLPPGSPLITEGHKRLQMSAYQAQINIIRNVIQNKSQSLTDKQNNSIFQSPAYSFYEQLIREINSSPAEQQLNNTREITSLLSHPVLMLPGLQESVAASSRTPQALLLPRSEMHEDTLISNLNNMRNFMLQRYLMYQYNPETLDMIYLSYDGLSIEYGPVQDWKDTGGGKLIDPLPTDRKYASAVLKTSNTNKISLSFATQEPPNQMLFMFDDNYFVLLKPEVTQQQQKEQFKQYAQTSHKQLMENPYSSLKKSQPKAGSLKFKFKHKNIVKIKQEKEKLQLIVLKKYDPVVETMQFWLQFDQSSLAKSTLDFINKRKIFQLQVQKSRINNFVNQVCDAELASAGFDNNPKLHYLK